MNHVSIIGRLGRDPQMNGAGTMASFSVAVQRQFRNKQTNEYESDWFNCKAFSKTAELVEKNFFKGSQIAFSGRLQNNNYEKDGKKIYRDEIIVDNITFIGGNSSAGERLDESQGNTHARNSNQDDHQSVSQNRNDGSTLSFGETIDIDEDDLPF